MWDRPCTLTEWRRIKERAYSILPGDLAKRVKFLRVSDHTLGGDQEHVKDLANKRYEVLINNRANEVLTEELVIHAIAHIRADMYKNLTDTRRGKHDAVWGILYAETYTAFHGVW